MLLTISIGAGATVKFVELADFFRLLSTQADVDVRFFREGADVVETPGVSAGYGERFSERFDAFEISSATAQTIKFVTRLGNVVQFDAPPTGDVNVVNVNGAHANTRATVLSSGVSTLAAANAARRFLLLQNNDASVALRVTCDGVDPTTTEGVRVEAGGSLLLDVYPPTGAVKAIAESGAGVAVEIQEG